MEYCDLRPAVEAYKEGRNVMATLREMLGTSANNDDIVEIAYDLQAGAYSAYVESNRAYWTAYSAELASILARHVRPGARVLDVGTGEMTTLAGVAPLAFAEAGGIYACDISFSRIKAGQGFVRKHLDAGLAARVNSFVGNLFRLPFLDDAVDVVWTSHALEPNGGKEVSALQELFRVAAEHVVLFEPSYEANSDEGRRRMDSLGYIRGLPEAIRAAGGELADVIALETVSNPLNPTHAYVCRKAAGVRAAPPRSPWACPATRLAMDDHGEYFFSPESRLAYPVISGVPVLRAEQAVLASALE